MCFFECLFHDLDALQSLLCPLGVCVEMHTSCDIFHPDSKQHRLLLSHNAAVNQ